MKNRRGGDHLKQSLSDYANLLFILIFFYENGVSADIPNWPQKCVH